MWRVIPGEWIAYYAAFLSVGVFLVMRFIHREKSIFAALLETASIVAGVTYVAGKLAWSPIAALPFISEQYPDVNGMWRGQVVSNLPDPKTNQPMTIPVEVCIEQDFLDVRVSLASTSGSATSRSLAAWPERNDADRAFRLWYLYEVRSKDPRLGAYQGAAWVDARPLKLETGLEGEYWTNSDWHNRGNTAGTIKLQRVRRHCA